MKCFVFYSKVDGQYLDTSYHNRYSKGIWRDKPRLYKSVAGVRMALNGITSPAFVRVVGEPPAQPTVSPWPRPYFDARRAYYASIRAIPTKDYFALLAEDGYELIEKEIEL